MGKQKYSSRKELKMKQREERNERIAFFSASLRGGGAERVIVKLANYCAQKGHPVDLVLVKKEGPYLQDLLPAINVIDLGTSRTLFALLGLTRYLKRTRLSVLVTTMAHVNIIALLANKMAGLKTRVLIKEVTLVSKSANSVRGRLVKYMMKRLYPAAALIIAVSKGVALDLEQIVGGKLDQLIVINDPVVDEDLLRLSLDEPDHPWLQSSDIPVILAAGRLSGEKDYPTLLRALKIIVKQVSARLVILGEGDERQNLEELIVDLNLESTVSLPGFKANPFAYMRKAVVFVLSSRWEGLSNVLIQAMAVGTPVVATDCPCGPAEVLVNGKYGPLVPVGDPAALAEAILKTMQNPLAPEALKERANDFKAEVILQKHYEEMRRGLSVG